jgi:hypothetical protein
MTLPPDALAALFADPALPDQFAALCDCGGRLAGTESERRALDFCRQAGAAASGGPATILPTPYGGWRATEARLSLIEAGGDIPLTCQPLVRSVATEGLEAEVLSAGRGTPEEFAALGDALRGRIALVRHEYMFAAGHIHRRRKYAAALAAGAAGFLIAGPCPGSAVAGSSGRGTEPGIPAMGISPEAAARLTPAGGALARARIVIRAEEAPAETETQLFDVPGAGPGWVVLSAHVDGHDPAESAMDNATGVAVALAVVRALTPHAGRFKRGLRLALFSAEEWALTGSRVYLAGLPETERALIGLNVNLDSVGGASALTALCSGFPALGDFVRRVSGASGVPVGVYMPLMENSDHANFAAHGIPALRLVAGFDDSGSNLRHVLTAADTRDKVQMGELRLAAVAAASLSWAALTADEAALAKLRQIAA